MIISIGDLSKMSFKSLYPPSLKWSVFISANLLLQISLWWIFPTLTTWWLAFPICKPTMLIKLIPHIYCLLKRLSTYSERYRFTILFQTISLGTEEGNRNLALVVA